MVHDETVESGERWNVVALSAMLMLLLGGGSFIVVLVRTADGDPVQIGVAGLVFVGILLGSRAVRLAYVTE